MCKKYKAKKWNSKKKKKTSEINPVLKRFALAKERNCSWKSKSFRICTETFLQATFKGLLALFVIQFSYLYGVENLSKKSSSFQEKHQNVLQMNGLSIDLNIFEDAPPDNLYDLFVSRSSHGDHSTEYAESAVITDLQ
ncbi:hypothetical protein AVEN_145041-1 [Araneus ventricosus]|uniref:Uncharacterized protein n=1 Tax=Araneus ventricosus TaxID=182803 RepID=A0A4Y2MG06_ARAVE|nr:hypothetical protein AVEN_59847-1 [Araneus ventricosus]GBN25422.1 hypothetical protein AVEN_145041-1 [Araneus ventricosus]